MTDRWNLMATLDKSAALFALTQPLKPNPPANADVLDCKSIGGMPFKVLAKNRQWGQDFWNGFVGPQLGADMDVETWIRGPIPPVADTDGIHKTFDIKFINLGPLGAHWAWPETQDHAKWGITVDSDWICVGDINRMISQRKRGGGTVAFQNRTLWQALSKTDLILAPPGHTGTRPSSLSRIRMWTRMRLPPRSPLPRLNQKPNPKRPKGVKTPCPGVVHTRSCATCDLSRGLAGLDIATKSAFKTARFPG